MIKLNLKKLQQVERDFCNSPVSLSVIERMVRYALDSEPCEGRRISIKALTELGVLEDDKNKEEKEEKQHLNS